jgi:hypothetical protein
MRGIGIGVGLSFGKPAAVPTGSGGMLTAETSGIAFDFTDGTMTVKQTGTLVYDGPIIGGPATIVGTLTFGANGSFMNASNNLNAALATLGATSDYRTAATVFGTFRRADLVAAVHTGAVLDNNGNNNEHKIVAHTSGPDAPRFQVLTGGVTEANIGGTGWTAIATDTNYKVAGAVQLNSANAALNGTINVADTAVALPVAVTHLRIGVRVGGTAPLDGNVLRAMFLPRRMSDAELQTLTT